MVVGQQQRQVGIAFGRASRTRLPPSALIVLDRTSSGRARRISTSRRCGASGSRPRRRSVSSLPLWKLTPLRILKVQVAASFGRLPGFGERRKGGAGQRIGSRPACRPSSGRRQKMNCERNFAGSLESVAAPPSRPSLRWPPRLGSAAFGAFGEELVGDGERQAGGHGTSQEFAAVQAACGDAACKIFRGSRSFPCSFFV